MKAWTIICRGELTVYGWRTACRCKLGVVRASFGFEHFIVVNFGIIAFEWYLC